MLFFFNVKFENLSEEKDQIFHKQHLTTRIYGSLRTERRKLLWPMAVGKLRTAVLRTGPARQWQLPPDELRGGSLKP